MTEGPYAEGHVAVYQVEGEDVFRWGVVLASGFGGRGSETTFPTAEEATTAAKEANPDLTVIEVEING